MRKRNQAAKAAAFDQLMADAAWWAGYWSKVAATYRRSKDVSVASWASGQMKTLLRLNKAFKGRDLTNRAELAERMRQARKGE